MPKPDFFDIRRYDKLIPRPILPEPEPLAGLHDVAWEIIEAALDDVESAIDVAGWPGIDIDVLRKALTE